MNIILLISHLGQGGAEAVFLQQVQVFKEKYNVTPVLYNAKVVELRGGESFILLDRNSDSFLFRSSAFVRFLSRAITLRCIVRSRESSCVISHMDGTNWLNILAGHAARKILVVHGSIFGDRERDFRFKIMHKLGFYQAVYSLADSVIVVSDDIRAELIRIGVKPNKIRFIPNMFDINRLKELGSVSIPEELGSFLESRPCGVSVGRLAPQKGLLELLDVLGCDCLSAISFSLIICGDGNQFDELWQKSCRLGLNPARFQVGEAIDIHCRVLFMGYLNNPHHIVKSASIFLLPSKWEGFPLAMCEALAQGVPVLASDCPTGPREIAGLPCARSIPKIEGLNICERAALLPCMVDEKTINIWARSILQILQFQDLHSEWRRNSALYLVNLTEDRRKVDWFSIIDEEISKAA